MAAVFRAHDLELGEPIALKVFATSVDDAQLLERFKQELRISRQLSHPNIIRVHDIGVWRGHRYISMELLVGADLRAQMPPGEPLAPARAVNYLVQACAGLQCAHDRGIIHRDIKPENFFVTRDGVLKVMDFGVAKAQSATPQNLTVAGMIGGTPAYMAPEQINSFSAAIPASDLYSLGVVAYEMLTGMLPFNSPELMPLLVMHLSQPPPPPRTINPNLSPALESIILELLAKDPSKRPTSARELALKLRALLGK
jgi:serine/threonine-protein kinase